MKISIAEGNKDTTSFSIPTTTRSTTINRGNLSTIHHTQASPYLNRVLREQSIADNSVVECVRLTGNRIIMATADRVWVRSSVDDNNFLSRSPTGNTKSVEITKKLLDTAIILGKRAASVERQLPALNLTNWIWSLISQYHLTHPTPQLMREAARRFKAQSRKQLVEWANEKAIEETGHDKLALLDIKSLGYEAQALVNTFMPSSAKVLVDYFIRSVQTTDPIKAVGYAYTLERIALAVKEKHIRAIEAIIPSGINATRCLRVHSSIGSDVEHVEEALEMIAQLSSAERNLISLACYETAKLYFSTRKDNYLSTTELKHKLQPFKH